MSKAYHVPHYKAFSLLAVEAYLEDTSLFG